MLRKLISRRLIWRYALYNWFLLKYRGVQYDSYPKISGKLYITGEGGLKFGKNVRLNSCLRANPIGGDTRIILSVSKTASMEIGDNTGISNSAIICHERIIIGNNVLIGGSVKIYDSDFHSLNASQRTNQNQDTPLTSQVVLEDGCFIGAHSIILKGVTIGKNSIVGAGSVVAKSIPKNEIWAGNPAKLIKKLT